MDELIPTEEEVGRWLLDVVRHSCNVEYFFKHLSPDYPDIERPHDLAGPGNKLEWDAIRGFALQYREKGVDFDTYVKPALEFHRRQYHHKMWNGPDPINMFAFSPSIPRAVIVGGAIDAVGSLLEDRGYQGGAHTYPEAIEIAQKNPPHKAAYMLEAIPKMRAVKQPDLNAIQSIHDFPNIGLDQPVYEAIVMRTKEAIEMLRNEHGYVFDGVGTYGIL